jgi:uncharacterized protein
MKKRLNILAFILALFVLAFVYDQKVRPAAAPKASRICARETCFRVEVAETQYQKERGLMFREKLADDSGMLFWYDRDGIYSFWMKNTYIPLDMIWVSASKEVVFVEKNAQPCLPAGVPAAEVCPAINLDVPARYVLEVNAGMADRIGLQIGDQVEIK